MRAVPAGPSDPLVGRVATTVGGVVLLAGTFLPWVRSGTRERSSYDLLGLVDRLGFAPDGWMAFFVRWWPIVPLLTTVAVVAAWWDRRYVAVGFGVAAVAYATAVAWTIETRRGPSLVGVRVTMAGAAVLLAATVWHAGTLVRARAPVRADRSDRSAPLR